MRHGRGVIDWLDDTHFEGIWENGKLKKGQMNFYSTGTIYNGEIRDGYFEGMGLFTSKGTVKKGMF